jgi:aspartyl-tRNA(Asn)/glutamyl-tRNA(Gln) amidotransferase subunit A
MAAQFSRPAVAFASMIRDNDPVLSSPGQLFRLPLQIERSSTMSREIALLSATDLVRRFRDKSLSPVEATKAALARIDAINPALNAFCLVDHEASLAAARTSEARWHKGEPLGSIDGVPTSIKDLVLTDGWPTRRGSHSVDPAGPWTEDAPSTARLREAGAVLLGKTTTPEFGWKGVTDSPLTGITRNPWNPEKTPGGSSGGAAVAAATGMGALHIGTDGGGSIRIPAGFTGIVGFKQNFARVPAHPLSPFGTVAHVGPMTRTVADAALMFSVIAAPDDRDWYAVTRAPQDWSRDLGGGIKGWRIAWSPTMGGNRVDPEIAALCEKAARSFADLGAHVEAVDPPIGACGELFKKFWFTGAANLMRGFGPEQKARMDPGLVEVAAAGARLPLLDYLAAIKERETLSVAMNRFHADWDLLLTPTMPIAAFEAGAEVPVSGPHCGNASRWTDWTPFSYPFNLTQQPAISVPCGFTSAGLPVGLQIVGRNWDDAQVLRAAHTFEQAHPFSMPAL